LKIRRNGWPKIKIPAASGGELNPKRLISRAKDYPVVITRITTVMEFF
jgi:hypothetical protein